MKKFKTFLPLAFIGVCSFAASTSCDSGDREAEATAALQNTAFGQLRGFDPTIIANNPNGAAGLPFSLIQGDTITFSNPAPIGGESLPPASLNLSAFTVVAPNTLRRGRTGSPLIGVGDESSFTQLWAPIGLTTSTAPTHSSLTSATIELSGQHDWFQLGITGNAGLPTGYQELYESSANPGSINSAFREWVCDSAISLAQLNIRQQRALSSIGLYAFNDTANNNIVGPMVRRLQTLTLTMNPTTNQQLSQTQQISGTYILNQTFFQVDTGSSAPVVIAQGSSTQNSCNIDFDPVVVVNPAGAPVPFTFAEQGNFVLNLAGLTLP